MKNIINSLRITFLTLLFGLVSMSGFAQTQEVQVKWTKGLDQYEVGYEIIQVEEDATTGNITYTVHHCIEANDGYDPIDGVLLDLPVGDYEVRVFDYWGDGWNGGKLELVQLHKTIFSTDGPENLGQGYGLVNKCDYQPSPVAGANPAEPVSAAIAGTFAVVDVPCKIQCPDDVVVDSDPNVCSTFVTVPKPGSTDCVLPDTLLEEYFDACAQPAGWTNKIVETYPSNTSTSVTTTPGACNAVGVAFSYECGASSNFFFTGPNPNFSGCVATMNDDRSGGTFKGVLGIESPVVDMSGASADAVTTLYFDYIFNNITSFDDASKSSEIRVECYDGANWNVEFSNSTDTDNGASVALDISAYTNADFQFRVVHDDHETWGWGVLFDNVLILRVDPNGDPIPAINDYNNTADASDTYEVGETLVNWAITYPGGYIIDCNMKVTVKDVDGVKLSCPKDVEVTLDPGDCEAFLALEAPVASSCNGFTTNNTLPTVFKGGDFAFAGDLFQLTNNSPNDLKINSFDLNMDYGNLPVAIYVTEFGEQYSNHPFEQPVSSDWKLIGSATLAGNGKDNPTRMFVQDFVIPAGATCGVSVFAENGGIYDTAGSDTYQTEDLSVSTGSGLWFFFGFLFTDPNWTWNGNINYSYTFAEVPAEQVAGPAEGEGFPIGTTELKYSATDDEFNTSSCTYNVIVNNYPTPTKTLACNDMVQVSFDETCVAEINADMVLEGGPYSCYNDYAVKIFNEMPSNFATATPDIVGNVITEVGVYWVGVYDAQGNNCWGQINVLDKLPPIIECRDVSIYCNEDLPIVPDNGVPAKVDYEIANNVAFSNANAGQGLEMSVEVSAGVQIKDINVYVNLDHSDLSNVILKLTSPAGTTIDLIGANPCPGEFSVNCVFDDESGVAITLCDELDQNGGAIEDFWASLSDFYGENPNGIWTLEVFDGVAANDGVINSVVLHIETETELAGVLPHDACGDVELTYTDVEEKFYCEEVAKIITRTWTATDLSGNTSSCVQKISVLTPDIANISMPRNWDGLIHLGNHEMLECGDNTHPDYTGWPAEGDNYCGILEVFYQDVVYDNEDDPNLCGLKILRYWTLINDCAGTRDEYVQIIRVTDKTAPSFTSPISNKDTVLASVGAYVCKGRYTVPELKDLKDNCDTLPTYKVLVPEHPEVLVDGHLLTNLPFGVSMVVYEATDACDNVSRDTFYVDVQDLVPPIAVCEQFKQVSLTVDGRGTVCAEDFDSGSLDNCSDIYFRVSRDNVTFSECVEFGCTDIGESQMVTLRVYDVEIEGGNVGAGAYAGHYNDCMSNVEVLCKLPPVITCQDTVHVPVDCEKLDSLGDLGSYLVAPTVQAVCEPTITHGDIIEGGDLCNREYSVLWTVESCGKKQVCNQVIVLETEKRFNPCTIVMPEDVQAECKKDLAYAEPTWESSLCDMVTAEIIHEDTFKFVDGACFKILREWAVIDWCVYKQNTGAEEDRDIWVGRELDCDSSYYQVDYGFDGYYRYTQVLMMIDEVDPEVEVSDTCIGIVDCTAYPVSLTASAVDTCNLTKEYNWKYRILDVESLEVVQYSSQYSIDPSTDDKIGTSDKLRRTNSPVINLNNALPIGEYRVEWTVGDGCGNIGKGIQNVRVADKKAPTPVMVDIATAVMENGEVDLRARTFDKGGCDNGCISSFDNCSDDDHLYFTFDASLPHTWEGWQKDGLGLYYFNPKTGVQMTREDFEKGSADAWDEEGRTAIRRYHCDSVGVGNAHVNQDVYVWDRFGAEDLCDDNDYDFATVVLSFNNCAGGIDGYELQGLAKLVETNEGVENINMTAMLDSEISGKSVTGSNGNFAFNLNAGKYTVYGSSDEDVLNGVTTIDIVLIQKHILGLSKFDSKYDYLAADASKDGKVSVTDVAIIRKVILAVEDNFINNSWVAISNETGTRELELDLNSNVSDADFTVVKIGDLNHTAGNVVESRTGGVMSLELDNEVLRAGEQLEVPVYAKDFTDVRGGQFAISLNNLKVESLKGGKLAIDDSNYNVRGNNLLVSWSAVEGQDVSNGDVLFTMVVEATSDVSLSNALSINDSRLRSEAYKGSDLEISAIELSYRNSSYALYQNTPNPFVSETTIGFELPESSEYTLTVYDVTGKLVKVISETGKAGYNTQTISKKELQASGVLYYRLESGDYTATKKMVILK